MTLQFFDGFRDANTNRKPGWDATNWNGFTTGRNGETSGAAATGWAGGTPKRTYTLSTSTATIIYGIASLIGVSSTDGWAIPRINGASNLSARINASGFIEVYRNTVPTGTLLATSSGHASISLGTWHYYEVKAKLDPTTGVFQLRLDGVLVINFTGNTGTAGNIVSLGWGSPQTDNTVWSDDLYICDTVDATATQGRPNNDFLGDVRVQTLYPSAAGDTTQWTPSTGANWDAVNEVPPNTTDYVSDSVSGHRDLYNLTDLTGTIGQIFAVQASYYVSKSDAGAALMKPVIKENSVATVEAGQAPAFGSWTGITSAMYTVKPSNSGLWTASDVNALQIGQDVA